MELFKVGEAEFQERNNRGSGVYREYRSDEGEDILSQ